MIYVDTSAAVKLVRPVVHSGALSRWVDERATTPFVSSVLIEVELLRTVRRSDPGRLAHAAEVLDGIGAVTLSPRLWPGLRPLSILTCDRSTPSTWPRRNMWPTRRAGR